MKIPRVTNPSSIVSNFSGALLLFVTMTTGQTDGITRYLLIYFPLLVVLLSVLHFGRFRKVKPNRTDSLGVLCLLFVITLAPAGLSKSIALLTVFLTLIFLAPRGLAKRIPAFAYYAMIVNIVIVLLELILSTGFNVNFDPTVFNLFGAGRDETISTMQFLRFAGHHDEPGSLGTNLAALTILSLIGRHRPTFAHWVSLFVLISTLSITSLVLATLVLLALLKQSGISIKSGVKLIAAVSLALVSLFQILPMYGLNVAEYFNYRIYERDTVDGSIYVKGQLVDAFMNRGFLESLFGNRFEECSYCSYSKSLGFGFHVLFQSGLISLIVLAPILFLAARNYGLFGIILAMTFMLSRLDLYYPQGILLLYMITQSPTAKPLLQSSTHAARAPGRYQSTSQGCSR